MPHERTDWRIYAVLAAMPLFFSTNLVIGRAAVVEVEPYTLAFWRWVLAALIILPFAWVPLRASLATLAAHWRALATLGFLGMVVCGGGVYVALRYTTAANATLIYTSSPAMIVVVEAFLARAALPWLRFAGVAIAMLGVATIVLQGDPARIATLAVNPGDLGILFASVAWAIYSVILKRLPLGQLPTAALTAAVAIVGAAILLPLSLSEVAGAATFPHTSRAWLSILGLAIFPSVLAFACYQYGVKRVGPSVTSVFMYLLPVWGVLLAAIFLGEAVRAFHLAGMALVLAGVILSTRPPAALARAGRSG